MQWTLYPASPKFSSALVVFILSLLPLIGCLLPYLVFPHGDLLFLALLFFYFFTCLFTCVDSAFPFFRIWRVFLRWMTSLWWQTCRRRASCHSRSHTFTHLRACPHTNCEAESFLCFSIFPFFYGWAAKRSPSTERTIFFNSQGPDLFSSLFCCFVSKGTWRSVPPLLLPLFFSFHFSDVSLLFSLTDVVFFFLCFAVPLFIFFIALVHDWFSQCTLKDRISCSTRVRIHVCMLSTGKSKSEKTKTKDKTEATRNEMMYALSRSLT